MTSDVFQAFLTYLPTQKSDVMCEQQIEIHFLKYRNKKVMKTHVVLSANTIPHHKINPYGCDCMEYWTCALSGGRFVLHIQRNKKI